MMPRERVVVSLLEAGELRVSGSPFAARANERCENTMRMTSILLLSAKAKAWSEQSHPVSRATAPSASPPTGRRTSPACRV
jgi:hypothetical protein